MFEKSVTTHGNRHLVRWLLIAAFSLGCIGIAHAQVGVPATPAKFGTV